MHIIFFQAIIFFIKYDDVITFVLIFLFEIIIIFYLVKKIIILIKLLFFQYSYLYLQYYCFY